MAAPCQQAFEELVREERTEIFTAIRGGDGYQTHLAAPQLACGST